MITKSPFVFGFCNCETISLGNRSDALSHFTDNVLGQVKSLFRNTMSSVCVRTKLGWPHPSKLNSWSPTIIEKRIFVSGFLNLFFYSSGKSIQAELALTPTIQSPRGVKWDSFVISIVFLWFDLIFSCPKNLISYRT